MNQEKLRLVECESTAAAEQSSDVNIVPQSTVKAINQAHGIATMAAKNALIHAMKAGKLLSDVREQVPHGQWAKWLVANVPGLSDRTERLYRRLYEHREQIESASDPIGTIGEAAKLIAEPSSNRHDVADLEGQTFLGFMREQETQVNEMLSEIAADHVRIDVIMGEMAAENEKMIESLRESIPAGLTIDAIETREVSSVSSAVDEDDEPYICEIVASDFRAMTARYDAMPLTWVERAKMATVLEQLVTAYSVSVFRDHECTAEELEEYSVWSQEPDER